MRIKNEGMIPPDKWASDAHMTYFKYLQRRYRAGEEGSLLTMAAVVEMFTTLGTLEQPAPEDVAARKKAVEDACSALYIESAPFMPQEATEDTSGGES